MVVLRPLAPKAWLKRALAALHGQFPRDGPFASGELVQLSAPVPRLSVDTSDVHGSLLKKPGSWEIFVLADGEVGLASVRLVEGELTYGGVVEGAFAEISLDAAILGEALLGHTPAVYHPFFVECAPAGMFSLLFRTAQGRTRYATILEGNLVERESLELRFGLRSLVRAMERSSVSGR